MTLDLQCKLRRDVRGGTNFLEKIILIGLFVFVAALGIKMVTTETTKKIGDQGSGVTGRIHGGFPTEGSGASE